MQLKYGIGAPRIIRAQIKVSEIYILIAVGIEKRETERNISNFNFEFT